GSILRLPDIDYEKYIERIESIDLNNNQLSLTDYKSFEQSKDCICILKQAKVLSTKFDAVITNPTYMGSRGMNSSLKKYLQKNYNDSKSDLFAVFMERIPESVKENGFIAMITMESWMFLTKYEKLRNKVLS